VILRADARALPLVAGCVQCVVTSPPYFGLRDYGHAGQIGLEATPSEYVATLVQVFREVRRVLKEDGTVWLNLGDSYSGSGMTGGTASKEGSAKREGRMFHGYRREGVGWLKQKDLLGIPWRVAFALQADGWYLRSDIIWHKLNPMPESVTDRPTKAHEYLFLLSKQERYHYDASAIMERVGEPIRMAKSFRDGGVYTNNRSFNNSGSTEKDTHGDGAPSLDGRNRRSVWTIATMPYAGAHFATMPEALVEPCILAGCPLGGFVLDPFLGSGTVGAVAERLGRRWVGTDLSYQPLAQARTAQRGLRFADDVA
jgi:DNA modification methylase